MIPTSNFSLAETSRPSSDFVCCSNRLILAFVSGVTHSVPFFGTRDIAAGPVGSWYITDGLRVYSLTFDDVAPQIKTVPLHTEHSSFFEKDFEEVGIRNLVASLQSRDLAILCQPGRTRKSAYRLWESNGRYRITAIFQDCDELLDIRFVDDNVFAVVSEGGCVRVYHEEEGVVAEVDCPRCIEAQLSNNGRSVCMRLLGVNRGQLSVFDRITGEVTEVGDAGVFGISPGGEMVATLCDEVVARIHEWKSGATTEITRQPVDPRVRHTDNFYYGSPSWSLDGDLVSFVTVIREGLTEWSGFKLHTTAWIVSLAKREIYPVEGVYFPILCKMR